jgi:hypothetical protein
MKLTTLLGDIETWLLQGVRIDTLTVDDPPSYLAGTHPSATALVLPPSSVDILSDPNTGTNRCTLSIPVRLVYRFPYSVNLEQLPLGEFAAQYSNQVLRWLQRGPQNPDILQRGLSPTQNPIVLERDDSDPNDWIISLLWRFDVVFNVEAELVPSLQPEAWDTLPTPKNFSTLRVGLWRELLTNPLGPSSPDTLDATQTYTISPTGHLGT